MKATDQEIKNVSLLDPEKRYRYFIKKICDWEEIWVMHNEEDGYALNIDNNNQKFLILFPTEGFTKVYIEFDPDFRNFKPTKIDLYKFKDELVAKFKSKEVNSAFVFPVSENESALNVELDTICKDIDAEIEEHY
jgi:hypothetical protein